MELRFSLGNFGVSLTTGKPSSSPSPDAPKNDGYAETLPVPSSGGDVPEFPNVIVFRPFWGDPVALNMREVPRLVAVVRRCGLLIANDVASLPFVFERKAGKRWAAIERATGNIVDVWERANPTATSFEMVRDWIMQEATTGNGYLQAERHLGETNPPDELWPLRTHLVRVIPGRRRVPHAYEYDRGGRLERIEASSMIHLRSYTTEDAPEGQSDLVGIESQVTAIHTLHKVVNAYFKSGGRPGGAFSVKAPPGGAPMVPLSEEKRRELEDALNRGNRSPDDWFKAKVLPMMEWQKVGASLDEMNLGETKGQLYHDVCMAMGVTPWMIGLKLGAGGTIGSEKSGSETDVTNYVERTLLTKVALVQSLITERLCPMFGADEVRCRIDTTGIPHLVARRLDYMGKLAVATGGAIVTVNEGRAMVGLEPSPDPEYDEIREPASFGGFGVEPEDSKPEPDAETADTQTAPKGEKARAERGAADYETRKRRHRVRLEQYERRFVRTFNARVLDRQEEATVDAYTREYARARSASTRIDLDRVLAVDYDDREAINDILEELLLERGEEALADVASEIEIARVRARAARFIETQGARLVSRTTATTRERLATTMAEGEKANESFDQIVARIRDVFHNRRENVVTIARTETVRAYNAGAQMAWAEVDEVVGFEWITADDDVVRESHQELAGAFALKGEPFIMQNPDTAEMVAIEYPGDPNAPAWATINCRCVLDPVLDKEAERAARFRRWWYHRARKEGEPCISSSA